MRAMQVIHIISDCQFRGNPYNTFVYNQIDIAIYDTLTRSRNTNLEKASSLEQIYPDELLELFQSQHLPAKDRYSVVVKIISLKR